MHQDLKHSYGTTLLEVLIALLVLMAGFLAVAGLQTVALTSNHNAFLRSQAVIQAHDMSDRMYANTAGVEAEAYGSISGTPSNPPACKTNVAPGHSTLETLSCTPAQMAVFDAWEWNTMNASVLPGGQGAVDGPDANGVYTITISWVEQGIKENANRSFSFEVEPLP